MGEWVRVRTGVAVVDDEWHVIQVVGSVVHLSDATYPDEPTAEAAAAELVAATHATAAAAGFHVLRNRDTN